MKLRISPYQIFVMLLSVVLVFFVVKYFGRGSDEWRLVRVQVVGKNWTEDFTGGSSYKLPLWLATSVKKGDVEFAGDGKKIAEIMDVESYEARGSAVVYLVVRLRVHLNKTTKKYQYQNVYLQEGSLLQLSMPQVKVYGQVVDVNYPETGYVHKKLKVVGRLRNIEPWLISNISVNDKSVELVSRRETAVVKSVSLEPSLSTIFTTGATYFTNSFLENNPRVKDAVITLEIEAQKIGDLWYFAGNQPVKVAQPLVLYFPDYDMGWLEVQEFSVLENSG